MDEGYNGSLDRKRDVKTLRFRVVIPQLVAEQQIQGSRGIRGVVVGLGLQYESLAYWYLGAAVIGGSHESYRLRRFSFGGIGGADRRQRQRPFNRGPPLTSSAAPGVVVPMPTLAVAPLPD
jgi:hypothetical protein